MSNALRKAVEDAKRKAQEALRDPRLDKIPSANIGRRVLTSAILPFMDNPTVKGQPENFDGYSPIAVDMVPTGLYNLYNLAAAATGLPEAKVPYLDRANVRIEQAENSLREFTDIAPPQNPAELAQEVVGSVIVPGVKRAPRAVRPVEAAAGGSQASRAVSRAATAATEVGKTVAEAVVPFRQGQSFGKAAAIQTPVAVGLMEGIDAAVEAPEYSSLREAFTGDEDQPIAAPVKRFEEYLSPEVLEMFNTGDEAIQQEILAMVYMQQQKEKEQAQFVPPDPAWKDQLFVTSALAGTALGVYGVRSVVSHLTRARLNNMGQLVGVDFEPQYTNLGSKAGGAIVQADQPLRDAAKEFQDIDYERYLASLDSVTLAPLNTKTQHAFTTGELPHSALKTEPLAVTLNALAKDLSPIEQRMVDDALLARSVLDDIQRTGVQSAFNDKTPADLMHMVQLVENDPRLAGWLSRIRKSYRDQLDYMVEQELLTPEMRAALIERRPNYVHMSRMRDTGSNEALLWGQDSQAIQAQRTLNNLFERADDVWQGVQAGGTASTIRELSSQWAALIRRAEINRMKKDFLQRASNNAALSPYIKRLPVNETPNDLEMTQMVYENGRPVYYRVSDAAIRNALDFSPLVNNNTLVTMFSIPKKLKEFFTTGPGAPLFAPTSAVYDTITGIALRPKGYDLGLINEFKNKLLKDPNSPAAQMAGEFFSRFDPSVWVTAPIGALRLAGDELTHALGRDLAEQLMRQDGWFYRSMGPQSTKAWADRFASMYAGSIKSIMDEYGATTSNLFSPSGPERTTQGLVDIAPKFYSEMSQRAYEEALAGNKGFLDAIIKTGGNAFEQARANQLTRLYMNTVRLLHEGFRYQAFATNLPKVIGDEELTQLIASQTRRLAGDATQFGSSDVVQHASRSALYLGVGIQTLAEVGRKFKKDPITHTLNVTAALGAMTAMQWAYAASNPEAAERIRKATDSELSRTIFTPFGDLPVPPELRLAWGPHVVLMNEISGLTRGEFDPNFLRAIETMLDDDFQMSEGGQYSLIQAAKEAGNNVLPLNAGSVPLINAGAAFMGADLSFSKFGDSGGIRDITSQRVDALGGEGQLAGDALTATQMKVIQETLGTTVSDFFRVALDADRALDAGGGMDQALDVALSRIKDNTVRSAGPVRGMLFPEYERAQSVADTDFQLWYAKREGMEKARTVMRDITSQYITGADPRVAMLRPQDMVKQEYLGTALMPIGMVTAEYLSALNEYEAMLADLREVEETARNRPLASIEERNRQRNELNDRRRVITEQLNAHARDAEDTIRRMIGDPSFSYQNFDPKFYSQVPWPPVQPLATPEGAASSAQAPLAQ